MVNPSKIVVYEKRSTKTQKAQWFDNLFSSKVPSQPFSTPAETNMAIAGKTLFSRRYIDSTGWFSIVMLVFGA